MFHGVVSPCLKRALSSSVWRHHKTARKKRQGEGYVEEERGGEERGREEGVGDEVKEKIAYMHDGKEDVKLRTGEVEGKGGSGRVCERRRRRRKRG